MGFVCCVCMHICILCISVFASFSVAGDLRHGEPAPAAAGRAGAGGGAAEAAAAGAAAAVGRGEAAGGAGPRGGGEEAEGGGRENDVGPQKDPYGGGGEGLGQGKRIAARQRGNGRPERRTRKGSLGKNVARVGNKQVVRCRCGFGCRDDGTGRLMASALQE